MSILKDFSNTVKFDDSHMLKYKSYFYFKRVEWLTLIVTTLIISALTFNSSYYFAFLLIGYFMLYFKNFINRIEIGDIEKYGETSDQRRQRRVRIRKVTMYGDDFIIVLQNFGMLYFSKKLVPDLENITRNEIAKFQINNKFNEITLKSTTLNKAKLYLLQCQTENRKVNAEILRSYKEGTFPNFSDVFINSSKSWGPKLFTPNELKNKH